MSAVNVGDVLPLTPIFVIREFILVKGLLSVVNVGNFLSKNLSSIHQRIQNREKP